VPELTSSAGAEADLKALHDEHAPVLPCYPRRRAAMMARLAK
jgi:hypothetical protein